MSAKSTREHLLDVGIGLMHRNGYNATGLSDILKAADVPKGSFYHHFSSKEDFAAAALARYVAHEGEHAASVLNDSRTPPLKRLKRYFTDLTKTYGQAGEIPGCMMGRFSLEMAVESPQLRKLISASFAGGSTEPVARHWSPFWKRGGAPPVLPYSTVTDFARLRGWSTSHPRRTAM